MLWAPVTTNNNNQTPVPETPAKRPAGQGPPAQRARARPPYNYTTPTYLHAHVMYIGTGCARQEIRVRLLKHTGAPVAHTYVFTRARALARVTLTEHITNS